MKKIIGSIPKVDKVLSLPAMVALLEAHPGQVMLTAVRTFLGTLIAESRPEEKETIVKVIVNLINQKN